MCCHLEPWVISKFIPMISGRREDGAMFTEEWNGGLFEIYKLLNVNVLLLVSDITANFYYIISSTQCQICVLEFP